RNGIVCSKSFGVLTVPFPEKYDANGELVAASDSSVIVRAVCSNQYFHSRFFPGWYFSAERPEISLYAGDEDRKGHWSVAEFTPFADEATVRALLDFDLGCLTRWSQCRTAAGLMPRAVSLFNKYKEEAKRA